MEEILPPRVENGEETNLHTQMLGIGCDGAQRVVDCREKHVVEDSLVLQCQSRDGIWHGEHDVEIWDRQEFTFARFEPFCTGQGLALRTMPVAT